MVLLLAVVFEVLCAVGLSCSLCTAMRTLLLLSGGVESSVLLSQLCEANARPLAMFAHYSQRGAMHEHAAASAACAHAGLPSPELLDLRAEGAAHQQHNRLHIPLPHRNLALLTLALGWATTHACSTIALGLNREDFAKDAAFAAAGTVRYTTGTLEFVDKFTALASVVAPEVEITVPQADLTKADVVREGVRLGTPLLQTYSCMRGRELHCGTCLQCRSRRQAFIDAGVQDVRYESWKR